LNSLVAKLSHIKFQDVTRNMSPKYIELSVPELNFESAIPCTDVTPELSTLIPPFGSFSVDLGSKIEL
jgi:hypothetical protein